MNQRTFKPVYVKAESVPLCLRHSHEMAAVDDARWLVAFLQEAMNAIWASSNSPDDDCRCGLSLCFDLLRDKLAIITGELPFPMVTPCDNIEEVLWISKLQK